MGMGGAWAGGLTLLVVACASLSCLALRTGTDVDQDKARQVTDAIVVSATLGGLGSVDDLEGAASAVAKASAKEAPELEAKTIGAIATEAAPAVLEAVQAISADAALALGPAIEARGISPSEQVAQLIITGTIRNLTLEVNGVADPVALDIELTRAAEVSLDQAEFLNEEQRDSFKRTSVNSLGVALDATLAEVQAAAADALDEETKSKTGETRQDPLSGSGDLSLIVIAGVIGSLALAELLRAATKAFVVPQKAK